PWLTALLRRQALPSFPTRRSSDLSVSRLLRVVACRPRQLDEPPQFQLGVDRHPLHHRAEEREQRLGSGLCCQEGGCEVRSQGQRSEEHTSELQSRETLVCRLLLEK